ncbi:hypothetical protein CCACVL1_26523 [Corchorus capsularis]|uniref:Uncharacterized protein n=1 Tax=Corchorus capsularis TaxID=210143 RepID=A0A1R3GEF6_COCAP|nr:hypothetical protein CCACVL1_26523 [Corchorus capsularis]
MGKKKKKPDSSPPHKASATAPPDKPTAVTEFLDLWVEFKKSIPFE